MAGGARWERWDRWPYRVLGVALLLLHFGAGFVLTPGSDARKAWSLIGLPLVLLAGVLLLGPTIRRARTLQDREIRRNPTGKAESMDERLADVKHPRAVWGGLLAMAVAFGLATAWVTYLAASRDDSAFVGLAIYLFIPVPIFSWLAWRTRALLHRRA